MVVVVRSFRYGGVVRSFYYGGCFEVLLSWWLL